MREEGGVKLSPFSVRFGPRSRNARCSEGGAAASLRRVF